MATTICTLFDNDYYLGAIGLFNSLIANGFKGELVCGYRGPLPPFAADARPNGELKGARLFQQEFDASIRIHLVELTTEHHLTNVKPHFMLDVLERFSPSILFYLDPDICISKPWRYFEEWVSCGVALCEDVNSPLSSEHPRRVGWRRTFSKHGVPLTFRDAVYVNGGCVGILQEHRAFLDTWQKLSELMFAEIGGGKTAKIEGGQAFNAQGFANCFDCSDQDALNATIEACPDVPVSILDAAAMGFKGGEFVLPHALGGGKPWKRNYLQYAFDGRPPRVADKLFWKHCDGPIRGLEDQRSGKLRAIAIASFIGRFYARK